MVNARRSIFRHETKGKGSIPIPPAAARRCRGKLWLKIEGYQKVINGARAVIHNYRPHIPIDPAWPMVRLR